MPPSYKLIYFNWKGRAEGARYIFHLAGQEFEDYRVTKEEWKQLKPKTPLGQIPILEVDGKQLPQSHAIRRYLAEEFGQ
ncbi:hypothetical protein BSL78_01181 [Apostichopus japonicus]|uniref:glutathione transferase n=1 Tax=Stichopus japonicus TaxID=307972 RepID=A0A2G8LNU3_STIJA|nr:hypothetical protein BSL78_01181 [Apostichopus japonicus]